MNISKLYNNFTKLNLLLLLLFSSNVISQNGLGYYTDHNNAFIVFEKGKTYTLERTDVDSIRVGDNYLAYVDAIGNMKVFYNGQTNEVENTFPNQIIAASTMLVYKMQNRLMVVDNGVKKQLTNWTSNFWVAEELVVWIDQPSFDLKAYCNGEIYTIEKSADTKTIKEFKIGRNIFAYNDLNNHLKVFYNGQVYDSKTSNIHKFKCGKNTMAYYDEFYNEFKVFHKGEFTTICSFNPKEYEVSDDQVVYIDINDYFMVYYNKETTKLLSYHPNYYKTINSLVFYNYLMEYFVFYKGKIVSLEKFIPKKNVIMGYNSILYLDNNNRIKYFHDGTIYESFIIEKIKTKKLKRDLPMFYYANNSIAFFYDGKLYEYTSIKINNKH
jgi:hypothetical protein